MMYLIDTNIWLENLLDQERAKEVKEFLNNVETRLLYISDFTLHSIAIILTKLKKYDTFVKFLDDLFVNNKINLVRLEPESMKNVLTVISQYNLDFDDAYQYVCADSYNLEIISFDTDFDKTKLSRKTPAEIK
ncbi:MAG: VapC toxin family PIN domain ribonuclease [Ignavibacteriales bacterium CG_4_9_14_3_um_filter_30_11]|nr:MAG: VapC toxin family PIN domain ribonuclease [Ignavibacteriales bacterium CG_4_9_14_3_um_filter_30_11]